MASLSRIVVLAVLLLCPPAEALAQQEPEPLLEDLRQRFQTPALSLGAVFQLVADLQGERTFPGENGLGLTNMRLSLYGQLDQGFEYFFQSNFGSILDAADHGRRHGGLRRGAAGVWVVNGLRLGRVLHWF